MPKYFGLYKRCIRSSWEGEGSDSETLLAISEDPEELVERWNKHVEFLHIQEEARKRHKSHAVGLPSIMEENRTAMWNGSTGGGYASVRYICQIKEFIQFDDFKEE